MDATEKLTLMMIRCGLATGHGDTIDDLIFELEKQIKNTSHAFSDALKEIEQLRLANSDLQMHYDHARTECDKLLEVLKELEWQLKNQLYDAAYETVIYTLWPALKEKE
jgi:peptidoglycan hydrolase CwlO-like protein